MNIKTLLTDRRRLLQEQAKALRLLLEPMPSGMIRFDRNGEKWRWRLIDPQHDPKMTTIRKDDQTFAQKMAEKRLLTDLHSALNTQIEAIDRFLAIWQDLPSFPDGLNESCPDYPHLIAPMIEEDLKQMNDWKTAPYESLSEYPERLIVPTKAGVMVRSKSEASIVNCLYDRCLAFHYEEALMLCGIKIYPDFRIWNPGKGPKFIIWEHFGMMHVPVYVQNARQKLAAYLEAGYIPGWNLIITFEDKDHPLDCNYIGLLADYHFPKDTLSRLLKI